tara:strand:- start:60 stop:1151 length:1092 start_codon:yes stop_codon:yes gene_type:complete
MMMGPDPYMMGPDPYMMGPVDPYAMGPEEEEEEFMGYYWNGVNYFNYNDYREATFYNGIYYLPEENGMYNDPVSAMAAYNAAMGGGGGGGTYVWGPTTYYDYETYKTATFYNGVYYAPEEGGGGYGAYAAALGGGGFEATTEGNDTLYSTGALTAVGTQGGTAFDALGGDDVIGGPAANLMMNDSIKGGSGNDVIYSGSGDDWVQGDDGNDELHGGDGDDILVGGEGQDILYGGNGQDILIGGGTANSLSSLYAFDGLPTTESTLTQDTFVFIQGQGGPTMSIDEIKGWVPGTDKIAFSTDGGNSYVANPFSDNAYGIGQHSLVDQYNPGMGVTMVYAANSSESYFGVAGNVTFDDTDVTTVV